MDLARESGYGALPTDDAENLRLWFEEAADSVVRIDDDDVELMSMDTIDLTGLYNEELEPAAVQRRAS